MDRFKVAVEDLIGIQLTDEETIILYTKYKYKGSKWYIYILFYFVLYYILIDANEVWDETWDAELLFVDK